MTNSAIRGQYSEAFEKIGRIVYNLNQIEMHVVVALSVFFADSSNPQSERAFILNDALNDESIFPTLENKRRMLLKAINHLWRVAEEHGVAFDRDAFKGFCESIKRIQQIRNRIAHQRLGFLPDGKVRYQRRKSDEERLADRQAGRKTGTIKSIDIDLERELSESQTLCDQAQRIFSDFLKQSREVLAAQQRAACRTKEQPHP